jgi:2,3-diaminopropionate biosynthesis protein SbnB
MKNKINDFTVIPARIIRNLLDSETNNIYEIIKNTYLSHQQKKAECPGSNFLRFPDKPNARIIALPASINNEKARVSGIKWISSYPENLNKNLPRASAVIILNDYETGIPYACMEGSIISATRTAYSAVLAAEHLNKREKKLTTLGFIGTSYIASHIYQCFISQNWEIEQVYLYDTNPNAITQFVNNNLQNTNQTFKVANNIQELITQSEMITFATTASSPYVTNKNWFQHNPKILHISLRDLSAEIILESENMVDDIDHVLSANTSPHLAYQTCGHKNFIRGTIAQLINSEWRIEKNKTAIFSPMGMGILDIAIADYVYKQLEIGGEYSHLSNFFDYTNN